MRMIDADALLKYKSDHETISTHLIYNAPTVDAVPVIRCKDCKWYYGDYCGGFGDGAFTPEYGFCHNAEREDE